MVAAIPRHSTDPLIQNSCGRLRVGHFSLIDQHNILSDSAIKPFLGFLTPEEMASALVRVPLAAVVCGAVSWAVPATEP
jgi:hypothetical protein